MKRFVFILLATVLAVSSAPDKRQVYITRYSSAAISEMQRTGIPASITMAQALLESSAGTSRLAVEANNHFGIKCGKDWTGDTTKEDDETLGECFRAYVTVADSYADHSSFLCSKPRYKCLFDLDPRDYKAWAQGLSACGYATDRRYADKLIDLIETYELYKLDSGDSASGEDGDAVSVVEVPSVVETVSETVVPEDAVPELEVREFTPDEGYSGGFEIASSRVYYYKDRARCTFALPNDTYESLAAEFNLFTGEILRFNGVHRGTPLAAGTLVFLEKPRK